MPFLSVTASSDVKTVALTSPQDAVRIGRPLKSNKGNGETNGHVGPLTDPHLDSCEAAEIHKPISEKEHWEMNTV